MAPAPGRQRPSDGREAVPLPLRRPRPHRTRPILRNAPGGDAMTQERWYAWAAGYFEANGCLTTARTGPSRRVTPCLNVTNTDLSTIERFRTIFDGCGSVFIKHAGGSQFGGIRRKNTLYCWQVTSRRARLIARLLFPYLVGAKRDTLLKNADLWGIDRKLSPNPVPVTFRGPAIAKNS